MAAAVPAAPAMMTAERATATNRRLELKILVTVILLVGCWMLHFAIRLMAKAMGSRLESQGFGYWIRQAVDEHGATPGSRNDSLIPEPWGEATPKPCYWNPVMLHRKVSRQGIKVRQSSPNLPIGFGAERSGMARADVACPHVAVTSSPITTPSAPASERVSVSPLASPWTGDQIHPRDYCSPEGSMPHPGRDCCEHVEW